MASSSWDVEADTLDELRGKHYLKKKDLAAYGEGSQYIIDHNAMIISDLRQSNMEKRHIIISAPTDQGLIESALADAHFRDFKLALQRRTAEQAIGELDVKASNRAKELDKTRYEREKKEEKLQQLKDELERMEKETELSHEDTVGTRSYTTLENAIDKAQIKYNTSKIIRSKYEEILLHMKDERLHLPAKLDAMETAVLEKKRELKEMQILAEEALELRDQTKAILAEVEQEAIASKRERDRALTATRKQAEQCRMEVEKIERRIPTQQQAFSTGSDNSAMEKKEETQRVILNYDEAFQIIKDTARETDVENVIHRVANQDTIKETLKQKIVDAKELIITTNEEVEKLREEYRHMKYSGETQLSRGQKLLEDINNSIDTEEKKRIQTEGQLQQHGSCLVNTKSGISNLLEKLQPVKLKPPQHNYTKGDVFDQMDLARSKIDQLLGELDMASVQEALCSSGTNITSRFQEFLEEQLPAENIRVRIVPSDGHLNQFEFDGQENDILTRTDIKKLSDKIIEQKAKKQKKK